MVPQRRAATPAKRTVRGRSRKVAVVTGGASGIGRACASALARDGYALAILDLRTHRLRARRDEELHAYRCDIADAAEVAETVRAIHSELGRIDVLVNCAGVFREERLDDIAPDSIDLIVGTNLIGTINVSLGCVPALKQNRGTIVNISSLQSQRPSPGLAIYAATKGAIESFTKALAVELAPSRVIVYPLLPEQHFEAFPDLEERAEVYHHRLVATLEEDREMVQSLQNVMSSQRFRPGPMSRMEEGVHHIINYHLDRIFGAASSPSAS